MTNVDQQIDAFDEQTTPTANSCGEIVGSGKVMRSVFYLVSKVAESDSSVLLTGETGTGKELIARALHDQSGRKEKAMVRINCAALPASLIESELFGHEKGSFTGALDRRIGKFELANHGTLFLDEIGELPLELQAKLLRAIQEKEIERLGGRSVIKTNVRIIAATNRDLNKEVLSGHFRSDLYFRLNVFPILIPPLRERKEDIPDLVNHFVEKHRKGRGPINFSSRAMKELAAYNWPGNVRELEHLIERTILLAQSDTITTLHLPSSENIKQETEPANQRIKTIDEVEREHILYVLRLCNGKVSGAGGAAEKLQLPTTTLTSKMKRLNIRKGYRDKPDTAPTIFR